MIPTTAGTQPTTSAMNGAPRGGWVFLSDFRARAVCAQQQTDEKIGVIR
jgi:hypothetical protein